LDSTLAEAWAALADYKSYGERDWEGAERAFRRANELNPSLAMNHYHYAWYLVLFGRIEEALVEHRRAQELDPLTPLHTTWLASIYNTAGDYETALQMGRENVAKYDPGVVAHYVLGNTLAKLGRYDEAIEIHQKVATIVPQWSSPLALTYVRAGMLDDARRIAETMEAEPPSGFRANGLARVYAALEEWDKALDMLEYEPAHAWMAWTVTRDWFDPIRGTPRFEAVMRRVNLYMEPGQQVPTALPVVAAPLAGGDVDP
jgi:tetratricopeptide (TPR) repeat protein